MEYCHTLDVSNDDDDEEDYSPVLFLTINLVSVVVISIIIVESVAAWCSNHAGVVSQSSDGVARLRSIMMIFMMMMMMILSIRSVSSHA